MLSLLSIMYLVIAITCVFSFNLTNTTSDVIPEILHYCNGSNTTTQCVVFLGDTLYTFLSTSGFFDTIYGLLNFSLSFVLGLIVNPHIIGLVVVLFMFYYMWSLFSCSLRVLFQILYYSFRPCLRVIRIQHDNAQFHRRGRAYAQAGYPDPPTRGTIMDEDPGAIVAYTPASSVVGYTGNDRNSGAVTSVDTALPLLVEEDKPPPTENAVASAPTDMIACSEANNVIFSGDMHRAIHWKERRYPISDSVFMLKDTCGSEGFLSTMALVDTFVWPTTAAFFTSLYNKSIVTLLVGHPRFKYIRSMWSYYRFKMRLVIEPTVNSFANGIMVGFLDCGTGTPTPVNAAYNIGLNVHHFIQPSANDHYAFDIPNFVLDRWLTAFYDTSTTIEQQGLQWSLNFFPIAPLQVPTGTATSLRYNIYMQLTDIHAKWPQSFGAATQGLFTQNNITISDLKNSTLPFNMMGDKYDVEMPRVGFDFPSDTRNPDPMVNRTFQNIQHTRGSLMIRRTTLNGCDMVMRPFKGMDETNIRWLGESLQFLNQFPVSTTTGVGALIGQIPIGCSLSQSAALAGNAFVQSLMSVMGMLEFDSQLFEIQIPKNPYLNGKILVTLTSGVTPPSTLSSGNLTLSTSPSMVIDLSSPELTHTFRVPYALLYEFFTNQSSRIIMGDGTVVPQLCFYNLVPMTATTASPTSVYLTVYTRYYGLRALNTSCISLWTEGKSGVRKQEFEEKFGCLTNRGKVTIPNDATMTRTVDDLISLRQIWKIPSMYSSGLIPSGGMTFSATWTNLCYSFAMSKFYRAFTGSLRFHFLFSNWTGTDYVVIQADKYNRAATDLVQPAYTSIENAFFNNTTAYASSAYPGYSYNNIFSINSSYTTTGQLAAPIIIAQGENGTIIEVPMITPNGYVMYPNDGPSWGSSFKITPVGATPKLTMQVLLSAGDDFEAHFLNVGTLALGIFNSTDGSLRQFPFLG